MSEASGSVTEQSAGEKMTNVISVKRNILSCCRCVWNLTGLEMVAVALQLLFLKSLGLYDRRAEELTKE